MDEVKQKTDIVTLVSEYVALKKAGRNYKALCPFHNEKTPSFMVSPERQIFKCFGCAEGGDVFAFYKKAEGVEFGEALRFLAQRAGVQLKDHRPTRIEQQREKLFDIHEIAGQLYHHLLTKHPSGEKALKYLQARGIKQKAIVDFRLGLAPRQEDFLASYLNKKDISRQDAIAAGLVLISTNKLKDRFRDRIVFPIFDTRGKIIAFSGRSLGGQEPKYLNSPDTPLFNKSRSLYGVHLAKTGIQKEGVAILVEGNLDVISSHQVGVNNVVAPLGTALTLPQIEILKRWTENLLFAFDTDLAGDAAAKRAIEIAENSDMNIRVVQLPEGKDPDEIIRKNPLLWKKACKEAVPVYDHFIAAAVNKYGVKSSEAKRKVVGEVLPQLAWLEDEILKAHYLQVLAAKLAVEETPLREMLKKYSQGRPEALGAKELFEKPLSEKGVSLIEKYLIALIIYSGQFPPSVNENIFSTLQYREIFKLAKAFFVAEGRFKIKTFVKKIPQALLSVFDDLLLLEIDEDILESEEKTSHEINYCTLRLKELNLRAKLKELNLAIKQAESAGNQEKVGSLSEQFQTLSKSLVVLDEVKYGQKK